MKYDPLVTWLMAIVAIVILLPIVAMLTMGGGMGMMGGPAGMMSGWGLLWAVLVAIIVIALVAGIVRGTRT